MEEENKTLFADDMIACKENSKESMKNIQKWTTEFSKVARYKIDLWKAILLLYTRNEYVKNKIKIQYYL